MLPDRANSVPDRTGERRSHRLQLLLLLLAPSGHFLVFPPLERIHDDSFAPRNTRIYLNMNRIFGTSAGKKPKPGLQDAITSVSVACLGQFTSD